MRAIAASLLLTLATTACRSHAAKPPPPRYQPIDTPSAIELDDSATADTVAAAPEDRSPAPSLELRCDPNYTPCVPIASDVDCGGGRGNGPSYVWTPVTVIGTDIYGLDDDGDGTGCDR
jgi:hypothetical protein